jgi:hypothetical protein
MALGIPGVVGLSLLLGHRGPVTAMALGISGVDGLSLLLGHRGALSPLLVASPAAALLDWAERVMARRLNRRLRATVHRVPP